MGRVSVQVARKEHLRPVILMPAPTNERRSLERERAELTHQIAAYQRRLAATPAENKARRERLAWQIRRDQKRLAEIEARPAAIGAESYAGGQGPNEV